MRHVTGTHTDPSVLVGLDSPDDAAVYRISDDTALVQTVDFFTPIVDDARSWGRIAAANALSDVYAMGARPVTALNLVGWPRSLDLDVLGQVLEGGEEICRSAGVSIVGGHSVDDPEPKYGLAVTGLADPRHIVRKIGTRPGDALVLTKALGTGVISSAVKEGRAEADWVRAANESMIRLNESGAVVMQEVGVSAATDVTGFGLTGHLLQMLNGVLDAHLAFDSIPLLPGALAVARAGIVPGGTRRNASAAAPHLQVDGLEDAEVTLLNDAQTSGGLLIALPSERGEDLISSLMARGDVGASVIGTIREGAGKIQVRRDG